MPTILDSAYITLLNFINLVAITLEFSQPTYNVNENDGTIQLTLVLSNPSSFETIADVFSVSDSATGE